MKPGRGLQNSPLEEPIDAILIVSPPVFKLLAIVYARSTITMAPTMAVDLRLKEDVSLEVSSAELPISTQKPLVHQHDEIARLAYSIWQSPYGKKTGTMRSQSKIGSRYEE